MSVLIFGNLTLAVGTVAAVLAVLLEHTQICTVIAWAFGILSFCRGVRSFLAIFDGVRSQVGTFKSSNLQRSLVDSHISQMIRASLYETASFLIAAMALSLPQSDHLFVTEILEEHFAGYDVRSVGPRI